MENKKRIIKDKMKEELLSIPIEISILFGNSEHPFPERKNMPFRSRGEYPKVCVNLQTDVR